MLWPILDTLLKNMHRINIHRIKSKGWIVKNFPLSSNQKTIIQILIEIPTLTVNLKDKM